MDDIIISFKSCTGKHTFVQQKNGDWIGTTRNTVGQFREPNSDAKVYWHGQTTSNYSCDYRKEFYMRLLKKIFDDNGIKYSETTKNIYVNGTIMRYQEETGMMIINNTYLREEYEISIFKLLTTAEAIDNIQKIK
jgi:hypothetical protein